MLYLAFGRSVLHIYSLLICDVTMAILITANIGRTGSLGVERRDGMGRGGGGGLSCWKKGTAVSLGAGPFCARIGGSSKASLISNVMTPRSID